MDAISSTLDRAGDGRYYMQAPDGSVTIFDGTGRKVAFWDRHASLGSTDDGNRLRFAYDGALVQTLH